MTILSQLLEKALKIKNQMVPAGNTATLVGGLFESMVDFLSGQDKRICTLTSGLIWQSPVNTVEDLPKNYPSPQTGWAALVKNKGTIYAWNGKEWVDTGMEKFPADVALNGGSDKTIKDLDDEKAGKAEVNNLSVFSFIDRIGRTPIEWQPGQSMAEYNVTTQVFGKTVNDATRIDCLTDTGIFKLTFNPGQLTYNAGDKITAAFQIYCPVDVSLFEYRAWIGGMGYVYDVLRGSTSLKQGVNTVNLIMSPQDYYTTRVQIQFTIRNQAGQQFYIINDRFYVGTPVIAPLTNNVSDLTDTNITNLKDGDILVRSAEGWVNKNISSLPVDLFYGIEIDTSVADSTLVRIGNPLLHKTLPVHSGMRRCLLKDDGTVNYYLHPNDSTKKANGVAAKLDGTDGQVMVEIPEHYRCFETEGTKQRCLISEYPLPGFHKVPLMYISAYEATIQRSANKLSSVVNTSSDYRGGNNNAANDTNDATLLGKAATYTSRGNFRIYARNRNNGDTQWNLYTYDACKALTWLYIVEYANLNSQLPYNTALTSEGYRQGGLGLGASGLNGEFVDTWNGGFPPIPIGITNSLGNNTGLVNYVMPAGYQNAAGNPSIPINSGVPSYRGVENFFGNSGSWVDGINIINYDGDEPKRKAYICSDPTLFVPEAVDNYSYVGGTSVSGGFIKNILFGKGGELIPIEAGGTGVSSQTYWCDSFGANPVTPYPSSSAYIIGGLYSSGLSAGLITSYIFNGDGYSHNAYGTRLCFIHKKQQI